MVKVLIRCISIWLLLVAASVNAASEQRLLVVYQSGTKLQKLFDEIISGLEQEFDGEIEYFPFKNMVTEQDLEQEIIKSRASALLGIGGAAFKALTDYHGALPVVVGGVASIGEQNVSGIEILRPSVQTLLYKLQLMSPSVKELHVVYDARQHLDIVGDIEKLESNPIKINLYPSSSFAESAQLYSAIFEKIKGLEHAVWLLDGRSCKTLNEGILNQVYQMAWHKDVITFTNRVRDVQDQKVLFALNADFKGMGESLAELVETIESPAQPGQVRALEDFTFLVNGKIARHLGLSFKDTNHLLKVYEK